MSAQELTALIEKPPATYAGGLEEAPGRVMEALSPGAVFFTIGAGDVEEVAPRVLEALREASWTRTS